MGVGEEGALGHEDDVAQGGDRAAEPDGRPVHRGHDGDGDGEHLVDELPGQAQAAAASASVDPTMLEVLVAAAGAEGLPGAGQHHRSAALVLVDVTPEGDELGVQVLADGVEGAGLVQGDHPHGPVGPDLDSRQLVHG